MKRTRWERVLVPKKTSPRETELAATKYKPPAEFEDILFEKYADSETNILPEGLSRLCKDIGLNMSNDVTFFIIFSLKY